MENSWTLHTGNKQFYGRLNTNNSDRGLHFADADSQLVFDVALASIASLTVSTDRYTTGFCNEDHKVTLVLRDGKTYAGSFRTYSVDFVGESLSIHLNSGNNAEIRIVKNE